MMYSINENISDSSELFFYNKKLNRTDEIAKCQKGNLNCQQFDHVDFFENQRAKKKIDSI